MGMKLVVDTERAWKRSWMPKKGDRAAILQLHKMAYHDQLCSDMGVNPRRKGWNLLAEVFAPYSAIDYADLFPSDGDAVVSAADLEARRSFSTRAAAVVLVIALLVVILAFITSGGSTKVTSLVGATVLAVPAFIDAARMLYIEPKLSHFS